MLSSEYCTGDTSFDGQHTEDYMNSNGLLTGYINASMDGAHILDRRARGEGGGISSYIWQSKDVRAE